MRDRGVILAGGLGSRLAPYTAILPKPLMPLLEDKSIIEHVLGGLAASGIRDVTITLGHLGHLIEAVVGDGSNFDVAVTYTRELSPLGTAGPLALLGDVRQDDSLLVVNGDTYTDLDYRQVLAYLDRAEAVIACVRRSSLINYGVIHVDRDGYLTEYDEKPSVDLTVSTGIYALRGSVLDLIEPGSRLDMPDLLRSLQSLGRKVFCKTFDCMWRDLGRPEDFAELQQHSAAVGNP
jgi:NDP-sugar pyrophosphorylase family protein